MDENDTNTGNPQDVNVISQPGRDADTATDVLDAERKGLNDPDSNAADLFEEETDEPDEDDTNISESDAGA